MKYTIDLLMKLTSPLHSGGTGDYHIGLNDRYPRPGKNPNPGERFAIAPQRTVPVGMTLSDDADSDEASSRVENLPLVPANTIRGRLRRLAGRKYMERYEEQGKQIDLVLYHIFTCGARSAKADNERSNPEPYVKASKEPYFGVFGGGPRWFRTPVKITDAIPVNRITLEKGMVPESLSNFETSKHNTFPCFFRKVDDLFLYSDINILQNMANFERDVAEWIAVLGGDNDGKVGISTFTAIQAIIPGTNLFSRLSIDTSTVGSAGLGLFLSALEDLVNDQEIGGYSRNGFGRFDTVATFTGGDEEISQPLFIRQDGKLKLNTGIPVIERAVEAWTNHVVDTDLIGELVAFSEKKEKTEAAKKAAKKAAKEEGK